MPLPAAVLVMALLLAGLVGYGVLLFRVFGRIRVTLTRRGYKSPLVHALVGATAFLSVFAVTLALKGVFGDVDPLWLAGAAFLIVPGAFVAVAHLLPARSPRTAGRRVVRFPYRGAGVALLGASPVLLVVGALAGMGQVVPLAAVVLAAGFASLSIARRAGSGSASDVLTDDRRPPVLYLRPFRRDADVFVEVPRHGRELLLDWLRAVARRAGGRFLTLEEYLRPEIEATLGPFVALGNPLDFVPPEGAARDYSADDAWRDQFLRLVGRAGCVVMAVGVSDQVAWELERLRALAPSRLFVLTPAPPLEPPRSWPRRAALWWIRQATRPRDRRRGAPEPWSTFTAVLRRAGYEPCGDPGPGAVVAFDADGRALVVGRRLGSARATVQAIHRRLVSPG